MGIRNSFACILLTVFVFNTFILAGLFLYAQKRAKTEMKAKLKASLNDEELTSFNLSAAEYKDLDWYEENEFIHNGELYDLVKVIRTPTSYIVKALSDKKEKQAIKNLTDHSKDQNSPVKRSGAIFLIYVLFNASDDLTTVNFDLNTDLIKPFFSFVNFYKSVHRLCFSPPPEN